MKEGHAFGEGARAHDTRQIVSVLTLMVDEHVIDLAQRHVTQLTDEVAVALFRFQR